MSINLVYYSNTFADWVTTTNLLVSKVNLIDTGDYVKSSGTLVVSTPSDFTSTLGISGRTIFTSNNVSFTTGIVQFSNTANVVFSTNTFFNRVVTSNNTVKLNNIYANGNVWFGNTSTIHFPSNNLITNLNSQYLGGENSSFYISITNTATTEAQSAFLQANTGVVQAQAAFGRANLAFIQANNGVIQAQSAFTQANTGVVQAQAAFGRANLAFIQANNGVVQAQAAFSQANLAFTQANTGVVQAQAAFDKANTTNVQLDSLGVGTAASGTAGEILATNSITAYYSDLRLKDNKGNITNALEKVKNLSGIYFTQNKKAEEFGFTDYKQQVGVIAQEVLEVLPEAIKPAPFDLDENYQSKSGENYLTVQYEKIIPLLIEAIKELNDKLDSKH